MANPTRTRSVLIGVLAALSIIAAVAISTAVVQINSDAAPPPPLPPTSQPAPEPTPEQAPPTVTETVTVDPTAPTTEQPTVTVTEQRPAPAPEPETPVYTPPPSAPAPLPDPGLSDAEIRTETSDAFDVVNTYWIELFNSWKDPQGNPISWWVPNRMGGTGFYDSANGNPYNCAGKSKKWNATFCEPLDSWGRGIGTGTVSWDMDLFRGEDDGAIYVTVAHEVAHAAQTRFWFDGEGGATPNPDDSPAYEQQADCLAGATLAKAEQDGYLTIEPGDLEEIASFFMEFESGADHGDTADRVAEFRWGYGGDIESCLYNQGVPPH